MRLTHLYAATAAVLLLGAPVIAQMAPPEMLHGAGTVADIKAGTYAVEPHHTTIIGVGCFKAMIKHIVVTLVVGN